MNKKKGQGLVEYTLVLALLALTCVFALSAMGDTVVNGLYTHIVDNVANAEQTIADGAAETTP